MILFLCWVISKLAPFLQALAETIIVTIITLAGLVILLRTIGLKIPNKLGSTIISGIFKILEKLIKKVYQAIRWIIIYLFKLISRVFLTSRKALSTKGFKPFVCNIIATIAAIIFLAIII